MSEFRMTPGQFTLAEQIYLTEWNDLRSLSDIFKRHKSIVAFRLPLCGEMTVDLNGGISIAKMDYEPGHPRFILRPPRKVIVTDIVFRPVIEGGNHVVREAEKGEYFLVDGDETLTAGKSICPWPIYTRHEVQREVEVDDE